ncbi:BolA/IbaG family iron-sulfur metabolism protein [Candidatus Erwinia haradaeae]|uniref:DNA-binding transcriptional regulator BolA n=1 Tax=Candidatus Erwinia haradaeae TaxID=1922217 RepID=A0A803GCJ9_9GAMM|nr:BolA/IbaG family iron-sulfur metabolism protein [Candidatus Erwinia haradaeae]VFP88129.1 DNA-binding transcriptional regulator BolA [Candidatus Erwinia haradaeae]
MTYKTIETKLYTAFNPSYLLIKDESHYHQSYSGLESHFKVIIVSNLFNQKTFLQRHRSIYSVLALELKNSIHALSLNAYSLTEWDNIKHISTIHASPKCLGLLRHNIDE